MNFEYQDNGRKGEFFLKNEQGQRIAEISYVWSNDKTIIADHTWVDDSLRGHGMARKLLDRLAEFAREKSLKIIPTCSYVVVMFKRDPNAFSDVAA